MNAEYIKNNFYYETLNEKHDLDDFNSISKDLNEFLKEDALKQQNEKLNLTKLILCDDELIGYVTLFTSQIEIKKIREKYKIKIIKERLSPKKVKNNHPLPCIFIGRFAIDEKYMGKHIGLKIFESIMQNLKELSETQMGFRFITLESFARAYTFYTDKHYFVNLTKDDEEIKKNLEKIIERDPEKKFFLYHDLKI